LATGAVSFHSDEAVVALMARHIHQGVAFPIFFYGQHYMGSLDALLIAGAFRVIGEGVPAIRLVQLILYLLFVVTTLLLAWQLSKNLVVTGIAGLWVAIPSPLLTLYTSMTLGGYGETLIIGNICLILGWVIAERDTFLSGRSRWEWALLGLVGGLGWWTNGLIAVYLLPVALFILIRSWRKPGFLPGVLIAGGLFIIGGSPWWYSALTENGAPIRWLLQGSQNSTGWVLHPIERALGFGFVGLPAVLGTRYPWSGEGWSGIGAILPVSFLLVALTYVGVQALRKPRTYVERYLLLFMGCFTLIFIGSAFGTDISGRYLLPLHVPFALLAGLIVAALWNSKHGVRGITLAVVIGVLGYQGVGVANAVRQPPGLTSQFDLVNHIPNDYDQQLIDFLKAKGTPHGFGTYWMTFRLAFLSGETVILDAWLPNKLSLLYTPLDRRYPRYTEIALATTTPVYVTANVPELDRVLAERLKSAGIGYNVEQIGGYRVYYGLSRRVTPSELGVDRLGVSEVP
jgi:4-amino-4-deoxy-L-arabinose transferase-like glycosyltransferase